ncbi:MAG: polyphosphate kinase 2 family protein [Planctomycetes bacterium]|nr:polyphosphate kinase 2 family protein [Planctomycetota bacterium]
MRRKDLLDLAHKLANRYRVTDGKNFRLRDFDPADTAWLKEEQKPAANDALREGVEVLSELQEMLYAQDRWAVLLIFQAMDAAGKDGAIKHVMSGVNPQGCQVYSFKAPSNEELDHDFMWRCLKCLPERGRIGIFNRSYYEETLVVRVHPELLQRQRLPPELVTRKIWKERFEDIRNLESYLSRNGVIVRKFFLHVSKKEQLRRFLSRLDEPAKKWKFSVADAKEREYWKEYQDAYEQMIEGTSTKDAPWYVIPADNKWFTRIVVAAAVIDALSSLDLHYPKLDEAGEGELEQLRATLLRGD